MPTFTDYINTNNKILMADYTKQLITTRLSNFIGEAKWPLLIGKDLFVGEFSEKTIHGPNATFKFKAEKKQNESEIITKSIYVVRRGLDNVKFEKERIVVGRSASCDITIVDYAISKQHAIIARIKNKYSIIDNDSTNGVKINSQIIKPKTKQ